MRRTLEFIKAKKIRIVDGCIVTCIATLVMYMLEQDMVFLYLSAVFCLVPVLVFFLCVFARKPP